MPRELEGANMVDAYGAAAVFGRVLGVGEMRRMHVARRVADAYHQREHWRDEDGNVNWAQWAEQHPNAAELLADAETEIADNE